MKKQIKNFMVLLGIIVFSILITCILYQKHFATDAYQIMDQTYEEYADQVLGNGRILQAGIFYLLGDSNIPYTNLYVIFVVISIIIISATIFYMYKKISSLKKVENKKEKIITNVLLFVCIGSIFFNYCYAENMIFIENVTMTLSLSFSIIASFVYTGQSRNKMLITFLLLIVAVCSYQATMGIFIPLSMLLIMNKNGLNNKIKLIEIVKIFLVIAIPLMFDYLFVKVFLKLINFDIGTRLSNYNLLVSLKNIIIIVCVYILRKISLFIFLIISVIIVFKNKIRNSFLINMSYIFIFSIIASVMMIFGTTSSISYRMLNSVASIGSLIGIGIYLYSDKKIDHYIFCVIFSIYFIVNVILFNYYINVNIQSTKKIKEVLSLVNEKVKNYELDTGIQVNKIAFYIDKKQNVEYWSKNLESAADCPVYYVTWSRVGVFNYYLNKKMTFINSDNNINNIYFKDKDWTEFDLEQFVIDKDTLHVCTF